MTTHSRLSTRVRRPRVRAPSPLARKVPKLDWLCLTCTTRCAHMTRSSCYLRATCFQIPRQIRRAQLPTTPCSPLLSIHLRLATILWNCTLSSSARDTRNNPGHQSDSVWTGRSLRRLPREFDATSNFRMRCTIILTNQLTLESRPRHIFQSFGGYLCPLCDIAATFAKCTQLVWRSESKVDSTSCFASLEQNHS